MAVGAAIKLDDKGKPLLTTVTDDTVLLTNRELDDHKCCIMSFLLMLATLIIYTWFTHSMKKCQKKLTELKDQLEEEKLKRQLRHALLGITGAHHPDRGDCGICLEVL